MCRNFLAVVFCLFLGLSAWAEDSVKQTLSAVPGDAVGFAYVSNIKQVDADFKELVHEMELGDLLMPPMDSLSGALKVLFQLTDGFDESGDLIIVVMPADFIEGLWERAALLVPATNGETLLKAMGAQEEAGAWKAFLMGESFVAVPGAKHVAFAKDEQTARAVAAPRESIVSKMKAEELKSLARLNGAIWLKADWLLEKAKPQIDGLVALLLMAQRAEGPFGVAQAESTQDAIDLYLEGTDSVLFGMRLDRHGLGMHFAMNAKPGSELQKQLIIETSSDSLLQGLPLSNYMAAMGFILHPDAKEMIVKNLDPYFQMFGEVEEIDSEQLDKAKALIKEAFPLVSGYRISVEALPPSTEGLIGASMIIETENSRQMMKLLPRIVAVCKNLTTDEDAREILDNLIYTEAAQSAGDLTIDHLKFDVTAMEEMEMTEEDQKEFDAIMGKEGLLFRLAAADDRQLVIGFGGGPSRMNALIEHAKRGGAPLAGDAGIKSIRSHLPANRTTEAYVALDHIFILVRNIMDAIGEKEELPFNMGELNAPLGMTCGGNDIQVTYDLFFPTALMKAVKEMIEASVGNESQAEEAPPAYQDF